MADRDGFVWSSVVGIADNARVPLEDTREALRLLSSPDLDSRSENDEGRRIEKVDRGWRIINLAALKERARKEAEKERKRRWWAKNHPDCNDSTDASSDESSLEQTRRHSTSLAETSAVKQSKAKQRKGDLREEEDSARCALGGFKLDSTPVFKPSARKPKADPEPESHETHELKLHYVSEFERTRRAKAEFGRRWSRAMKSFCELHEVHGIELAKSIITAALSDSFARRVTPWELVEDACKWIGERPKSGPKFTPPQPNDEKNRYKPRMAVLPEGYK